MDAYSLGISRVVASPSDQLAVDWRYIQMMELQMLRVVATAFIVTIPILMSGCAVVPQIDGASAVSLDDIAWRVKGDIWKVAAKRLYAYPDKSNPFRFLNGWGAKVHLTLGVDNVASVNSGATLIQPLPMSQSRRLGLGAGISTEAVSTTDFEFFMSFAELKSDFRNYRNLVETYCPAPRGLLVESDLHIEELFDRALEPGGSGNLRVGHHSG